MNNFLFLKKLFKNLKMIVQIGGTENGKQNLLSRIKEEQRQSG